MFGSKLIEIQGPPPPPPSPPCFELCSIQKLALMANYVTALSSTWIWTQLMPVLPVLIANFDYQKVKKHLNCMQLITCSGTQ